MTSALQIVALLVVAVAGTAVALTREPQRQALMAGLFGLALAVLFFAFEAPDVALSQIGITAVAIPAITLLALARWRGGERR